MNKNKDDCINILLNKNINKLKKYNIIINEGNPFFEKKTTIILLREDLCTLNPMNMEELMAQWQ